MRSLKICNRVYLILLIIFAFSFEACANQTNGNDSPIAQKSYTKDKLIQLSKDFLQASKNLENTEKFYTEYQNISMESLVNELKTDEEKLSFWMNTYNAFIKSLLENQPNLYDDRSAFFSNDQLKVAGVRMSFDDLEHGIIRNSKAKWSGGYIGRLFPPSWEKDLQVSAVDYRIHFALNCGAKSCPSVRLYDEKTVDHQLNKATEQYLTKHVKFNKKENTVSVPALLSWFRADFGNKDNVRNILKSLKLIPKESDPAINYLDYDWTMDLNNFYF